MRRELCKLGSWARWGRRGRLELVFLVRFVGAEVLGALAGFVGKVEDLVGKEEG